MLCFVYIEHFVDVFSSDYHSLNLFFFILLNTTYHAKMETEWSILRNSTQRQQNYIDIHERRTYNSHKNMPKSEKSKIKSQEETWIKNKMKKKDRMVDRK